MSLRDEILGAADITVQAVEVPEWGRTVHVRVMSGADRDHLENALQEDKHGRKNLANFRGLFAAIVLCDDKGKRLFSNADAAALGAKSAKALSRIVEAASKLNGMGADEVEEMAGNSEGAPSDASGSV